MVFRRQEFLDVLRVLVDLWRLPRRWRKRLAQISVPRLLEEIEAEVKRDPPLSVPHKFIEYVVRRRAKTSKQWLRNRCLLHGMLLLYLLPRAGRATVLHIGCALTDEGALTGHCWVSSNEPEAADLPRARVATTEIYCKTVLPGGAA